VGEADPDDRGRPDPEAAAARSLNAQQEAGDGVAREAGGCEVTTLTVWLLVFTTHVYSGEVSTVVGDFATAADCERVAAAIQRTHRERFNAFVGATCVQTAKVYQKFKEP
jgi:hypothetical protein